MVGAGGRTRGVYVCRKRVKEMMTVVDYIGPFAAPAAGHRAGVCIYRSALGRGVWIACAHEFEKRMVGQVRVRTIKWTRGGDAWARDIKDTNNGGD